MIPWMRRCGSAWMRFVMPEGGKGKTMHPFVQRILEGPVPEKSAALWWMGQMGLWIRVGETLISVDYFAAELEDRQTPPPVPAGEVSAVQLFLGTHDHLDHIDRESWKIWARTCPEACFVIPEAHRAALVAEGLPSARLLGLTHGQTVRVGEITIHAVAAAHEFLDRDPVTGLYPHLQYVIEGNGIRIYHAGDTVRYEGMLPALQALGPVDAALLPINGRDARRYRDNCIGNMTYQEAADLAGELRPGLVIPGHWDMFAHNSENPEAFADYIAAKYGHRVPCRIPKIGEPIWVRAGDKG